LIETKPDASGNNRRWLTASSKTMKTEHIPISVDEIKSGMPYHLYLEEFCHLEEEVRQKKYGNLFKSYLNKKRE
jgi:hypothetical protein